VAASHSHPRPAPPRSVPKMRPEACLDEAQRLADRGALAEAAQFCRSHLKEFGPSPQAYYLLGLVQDADGKRSEAAAAYRRALYLNPNHHDTLVHLALLLEHQNDLVGAKVLYDRARRTASERTRER
jgi:chemotaxis protein methyltransferase WspC